MANTDPFAKVRKEAQRALDTVLGEIKRRESELEALTQQAEQWRAAIAGAQLKPRSAAARSGTRRAAAKRGSGKRLSWDSVLKGLPKNFTVDDVMKRPGVKARGRAQVYPALTRWTDSKKVKRVAKGKYQKI